MCQGCRFQKRRSETESQDRCKSWQPEDSYSREVVPVHSSLASSGGLSAGCISFVSADAKVSELCHLDQGEPHPGKRSAGGSGTDQQLHLDTQAVHGAAGERLREFRKNGTLAPD